MTLEVVGVTVWPDGDVMVNCRGDRVTLRLEVVVTGPTCAELPVD